MSRAAIAFLAGLGDGFMDQTDKNAKLKRDEEDRALRNEAAQLGIDKSKREVADQRTLAQAGAPIEMTQGAGGMLKPDAMDNRDVGLPENATLPNQGLQAGGYQVGKQVFADQPAAQAALAAQNTPEATNNRILAAQQGIDPAKAMGLQRDMTQQKVANLQLAEQQRVEESAVSNHLVMKAYTANKGDAFKTAELIGTQAGGPLEGVTVTSPISPDGKSRSLVGTKDGVPTVMFTTTNDEAGNLKVLQRLQQTDAKTIIAWGHANRTDKRLDDKLAQDVKEGDSKIKLQDATGRYYDSRTSLTDATDPNGKSRASGKPYKMDEDDKIRLNASNTDVRDAEKAVGESMKGLMPGDDPTKNPATVYAQQRLVQAKKTHFKTTVELGQFTPDNAVTAIMGAAKSNTDVNKSLGELASSVGVDFADQVAVAVQSNDQWKAWNQKTKPSVSVAASVAATVAAPQQASVPAPARGYVAPPYYIGIEKVSASRGKPASYTYNGNSYPSEQAALAAYEGSKKKNIAQTQGFR